MSAKEAMRRIFSKHVQQAVVWVCFHSTIISFLLLLLTQTTPVNTPEQALLIQLISTESEALQAKNGE
jgi:uncharacterized PurR-regulated membrane protein YhhQ (DUF165 family)